MAVDPGNKPPSEDSVRPQPSKTATCVSSAAIGLYEGAESLELSTLTAGDVDGLDAKSFKTLGGSMPTFSPPWPKQQMNRAWTPVDCACGNKGGLSTPYTVGYGVSRPTGYICEDCQISSNKDD